MATFGIKPQARFEDPLTWFLRARTKLYSLWISALYPFAARGRNLSIHYPCLISRRISNGIKLGHSVIIWKDVWLNIDGRPVNEVKIVIDDNCSIGARSVISARNFIHIEKNVIFATSVLIQDHNHAYEDIEVPIREQGVTAGGRVRIEEGCWIGQGAAIVCNDGELVIGRNSVIGANSLVTKSVPPHSVVVGNPGRVARQFDPATASWVGGQAGRSIPVDATRYRIGVDHKSETLPA